MAGDESKAPGIGGYGNWSTTVNIRWFRGTEQKNAQKSLFAAGSLGKIAGFWSSGLLTFHWILLGSH